MSKSVIDVCEEFAGEDRHCLINNNDTERSHADWKSGERLWGVRTMRFQPHISKVYSGTQAVYKLQIFNIRRFDEADSV